MCNLLLKAQVADYKIKMLTKIPEFDAAPLPPPRQRQGSAPFFAFRCGASVPRGTYAAFW